MARDRQRAKQRQAQRQAARRAERAKRAVGGDGGAPAPPEDDVDTQANGAVEEQFELEASAPPEEVGRSDRVVESPPPAPSLDAEDEPEVESEDDRPRPDGKKRGKVTGFLAACWAELQRVQWPKRPAVTQLTGVVLGFVILAGGYLGLLDAIFSRLIQAIL